MSQELQDHAEQLAQFEAAEYWRQQYADLIDFYTPLRPAINSTPKAAVVTAITATSKQQGAIEHNGKR